jgi:hypothetical protein
MIPRFLRVAATSALVSAAALVNVDIDYQAFLGRHDPLWTWAASPANETVAGYTVLRGACAQTSADPTYRVLEKMSGTLAEALSRCDDNEWCPTVQFNASDHHTPYTLVTWYPVAPCADGIVYRKGAFDRAPTTFAQGAWVGNGMLGATLRTTYGNSTGTEAGGAASAVSTWGSQLRIDVGRRDVWDTRAPGSTYSVDSALLDRPRMPIGYFTVNPAQVVTGGAIRHSLYGAELQGSLTLDTGDSLDFLVLVDATSATIAVTLNGTGADDATISWVPLVGESQVFPWPKGYQPNPAPVMGYIGAVSTCTQTLLGGGDYATAWQVVVGPGGAQTLFVSIANCAAQNATGSAQDAAAAVATAVAVGFPSLRASHAAAWAAWWPTTTFTTLPDTRLEGFLALQLAKMGSSSGSLVPAPPAALDTPVVATQAVQPLDLFGPWYMHSRWGLYWVDMNAQVSHWGLLASNLPGLTSMWGTWLQAHSATLAANAAGANLTGLALAGTMAPDLLSKSETSVPPGTVGCLLWLAHNALLHARSIGDDDLVVSQVVPLLRGATSYYLNFLLRNPVSGKLHLPVTSSPEYALKGPDTNFDLALLRWAVRTLVELDMKFGLSDPQLPAWADVAANLTDYPCEPEDGSLKVAANVSFSIPHRHWSHLFAIMPLHDWRWRTADDSLRARILASLDRYSGVTCRVWMAEGDAPDGKAGIVWRAPNGFTYGGIALMNAYVQRAEAAAGNITAFLDTLMPAATLYGEENQSPNIESPLSLSYAAHQMMAQSQDEPIVAIFPAVPTAWANASFTRLRVAGGFLITAQRTAGATDFVHVAATAPTAQPLTLEVLDLPQPIAWQPPDVRVVPAGWPGAWNVTLPPGGEVLVYPASAAGTNFTISPLPGDPTQFNAWGWRKG